MGSSVLLVTDGIISLVSLRVHHQSGESPSVSSIWLVPDGVIILVSPRGYHQSG